LAVAFLGTVLVAGTVEGEALSPEKRVSRNGGMPPALLRVGRQDALLMQKHSECNVFPVVI
jgi:hypothetical protein